MIMRIVLLRQKRILIKNDKVNYVASGVRHNSKNLLLVSYDIRIDISRNAMIVSFFFSFIQVEKQNLPIVQQ